MGEKELTRREFLAAGMAAGVLLPGQGILPSRLLVATEDPSEGRSRPVGATELDVDYRALISHADLDYTAPVDRSEAGQPVGNGRMGSLVWTTSSTLRFQINRVDVHAQNHDTVSFPERNLDYGGGCGFLDINLGDHGEDVFGGPGFNQHLSVYDGIVALNGNGVRARVLACPHQDVLAVELEDTRTNPAPIAIDLRMLRYANQYIEHQNYELSKRHSNEIITRNHSATSTLDTHQGAIVLTQHFREGGYYNVSAVVVKVEGRPSKAPT